MNDQNLLRVFSDSAECAFAQAESPSTTDRPVSAPMDLALEESRRAGAAELLRNLKETDSSQVPYMPLVRAVRSKSHGYVYRLRCPFCGRMVHLQSRGEYKLYLLLSMSGAFTNIREGFGVPLPLTEAFAEILAIKHPYDRFSEKNAAMSVDFIVSLPSGGWMGIDYKPASIAKRKRVQDKFRLMRTALAAVGVPHQVVDESSLPSPLIENLDLLSTFHESQPQPLPRAVLERAGVRMQALLRSSDLTIYDAAVGSEPEFRCGTGLLVRAALWMVANRRWRVDLMRPVHPDAPLYFN